MPGIDSYTKLLLHCNGDNDSQEFLDSSLSPRLLYSIGDTQLDTAISKFGSASVLFDGDGDSLFLPHSSEWNLGTGNWTIDFWVYRNGTQTDYAGIISSSNSSTEGWEIHFGASGTQNKIRIVSNASGSWASDIDGTTTIPNQEWTHVALVRNGNTLTLYINGVSDGTKDVSGYTYGSGNQGLSIGKLRIGVSGYHFNGHLDEIRVSKGVARWTTTFTPPSSEHVPDSYTRLLLHCNGTDGSTIFEDDSLLGKFIDVLGDSNISTAEYKFGGASGEFDGTGDYLSIPSNFNLEDEDFTIDCWIKFNTISGNQGICGRETSGSSYFYLAWESGTHIRFRDYGGSFDSTFSWSPSADIWYHLAIVRNGDDIKCFIDGTQIGSTQTFSGSFIDRTVSLWVGSAFSTGYFFNGWIDEFRWSKGIARWTSNFTPPTEEYSTDISEQDVFETIKLADEWTLQTNPDTQHISDSVLLSETWNLQTNPDTQEIEDIIKLADEWDIRTNPELEDIDDNIILSDNWILNLSGTIRERFQTKLYTLLEQVLVYTTDLRVLLSKKSSYLTKLYLKSYLPSIYKSDLRVRVTPLDMVVPRSLDDFIVKLDGTELPDVDYTTLVINLNLNITPSNAEFVLARRHDDINKTLSGATSIITEENKIEIFDGTRKLFTGYISQINADSSNDIVKIIAHDCRLKLSRESMELKYGGGWLPDANRNGIPDEDELNNVITPINDPLYIKVEKNIGKAFKEVMTQVGSLVSGYDNLPFSGSHVPEYVKVEKDYASLIDDLIRQTANCNWYIDENERLRFQKIGDGAIKNLPLSSLNKQRHPYDLILSDVQLNRPSPNYAQSYVVKRGKHDYTEYKRKTLKGWGISSLRTILKDLKEKTYFVWHQVHPESREQYYTGMNGKAIAYYNIYLGGWRSYPTIVIQYIVRKWIKDLSDIIVGTGLPRKTLYLSSYGKKESNWYYEERINELDKIRQNHPWIVKVEDEQYDYQDYGLDMARFELSQNNKLNTSANLSMLLDAYQYYNLSFQDLINLSNTINSTIYKNNNGFPLNIESIQINCNTRTVSLNLTNYGKSYYAKRQSILKSFKPAKSDYLLPKIIWIVYTWGGERLSTE